ncbi:hypothetical protein E4U46_006129 [Claviceps purpurea]|nr:hypothetical protein E4U46_006129 [Claviceps purpurea]
MALWQSGYLGNGANVNPITQFPRSSICQIVVTSEVQTQQRLPIPSTNLILLDHRTVRTTRLKTVEYESAGQSSLMDHNWNQDDFKPEDLKETVESIHVCAHRNDENQGVGVLPPVNHWVVFLEISPTHSVCMDMALDYDAEDDDCRGRIDISTRKYRFTRKSIHRLFFPTKGRPKVEHIINLINNNGLHRYTFATENEGCRFWVYTLISYLETEGVVESGSAGQTWADASYYYIDPSGRETRDVSKGKFRSST